MDESEWEPIEVGPGKATGIDEATERVILEFPLTGSMPVEWRQLVLQRLAMAGDEYTPPPAFRNEGVVVLSREGEGHVKSWAEAVPRIVAEANHDYMTSVVPERLKRQQAAMDAEEDRQRRVEEAQRALDARDT